MQNSFVQVLPEGRGEP